MKAWTALAAMLAACGFETPPPSGGDSAGTDGPTCLGSAFPICFSVVPTGPVMLPDDLTVEIDTNSSPMCNQSHDRVDDYCVIGGASLTLRSNHGLRAFGRKPLVLLSTTTITIEDTATIDVSSINDSSTGRGAGANPTGLCAVAAATDSYSGGFGGSFRGKGGNGEANDGPPGSAGDPLPTFPAALRGGCPGAPGNARVGGGIPGAGGPGGGAVALVAGLMISLDGTINASGAGGEGGTALRSGGGGGGAGGMIVLDAPSIVRNVNGALFANGGGGGQGGAGPSGALGAGEDGHRSTAPAVQAAGGNFASQDGGNGGNGSAGGTRLVGAPGGGVNQAQNSGGGGGGGGGAGFIRAPGVTGDNAISPPSS